MEQAILEENYPKQIPRLKPTKVPHFGPLKGAALAAKQKQTISMQSNFQHRAS